MLCHFVQTRNVSLAFYFILLSSTATNSATGDYVGVRERFGQNEEPAGRNEERTNKKPSSLLKTIIKRRTVNLCKFVTCNHVFLVLF